MDSVRYLGVLRRRALLIAALTGLGACAALAFAARQHRVYSATATLLINPSAPSPAIPYLPAALGSGAATPQLAAAYDAYLHSARFQRRAARRLGLPTLGTFTTSLVGTTIFFNISAQAGSPEVAKRVANGIATAFIQESTAPRRAGQGGGNPQLAYLQRQIAGAERLDARLIRRLGSSTSAAQLGVLVAVENRLGTLTTLYNQLLAGQSLAGSSQDLSTATLLDPAPLPEQPITPDVGRDVLFGLLAGLFLGALAAFVLDSLDDTVRSPDDAREATGHAPLAVIPIAGRPQRGARAQGGRVTAHLPAGPAGPMPLVTVRSPHDPASEAFRALRTALAYGAPGGLPRSLAVTSIGPGEGKTTVAANLAIVLAQAGKRVILVDADLRQPCLHQIFGLRDTPGFADLLMDGDNVVTTLQATAVPNLRVLVAGSVPPNPADALCSDAVAPLLAALGAQADLLIVDTPPLGSLTDAVVLAARLGGALIVARSGSTPARAVAGGLEALTRVGARPLGIVLNLAGAATLHASPSTQGHARGGAYGTAPPGAAIETAGR